jgi:hypothetical protein
MTLVGFPFGKERVVADLPENALVVYSKISRVLSIEGALRNNIESKQLLDKVWEFTKLLQ